MKKDKMAVIQVIERAFNILTLLSEHPNGVGVTTISQSLQLPKSTTSRILSNLARFEAVCQTDDHRWLIGPGLLRLTNQQSFVQTLTALAHPCLQHIANQTEEAVLLSVPDGLQVHYLDHVETTQAVRVENWAGSRQPMHSASAGKLFLAFGSAELVERYLSRPLAIYRENTIASADALQKELASIRALGYATSREEYREGVSGISVPVWNRSYPNYHHEAIAALTVYGPTFRLADSVRREQILRILHQTRDILGRKL